MKGLPELDLDGLTHVLVLVAHPDDETLIAGGLLADLPRRVDVDVVVASDGEASHPSSPTHTRERLARLRRDEVAEAVQLIAPHARLHLLGLPDGFGARDDGLREWIARIVDAVVPLVDGARTLIVSTYAQDGHPDHEAVAGAASSVAWRTDARLVQAPIWLWQWRPDEVPWDSIHLRTLSERALGLKARALEAHVTQVLPLSDQPGDEALIPQELLDHFRGAEEHFIPVRPGETSPFEQLHGRQADPWEVRTSWYERRKRALTLALLPQERYAIALEIGCSIGALAADLADRCDRVVAVDESEAALATATEALAGHGSVDLVHAQLPEEWDRLERDWLHQDTGDGRPDLVVVSEVGYFMSPGRLAALADRIRESLSDAEHATVLACHWRHEIVGWPLRGDDVHAILDARLGLPRRSELVEDDVVLTVWSRHAATDRDET
ncbi:PIG-L family deacetylase [Ornithinimicrobium panacihumi]|uniref:PIG-L family deacetylase n=1 Tax=Ornithinimicrobium panacihumi TaxID=2008449 RepID=UPI003F8AAAE8